MQSYLGRKTSTALPRSSSSRLSPYTTSAKPPTLAAGASSGVIITTNMAGMDGAGGAGGSIIDFTFFSCSGSESLTPANPRTIASSEICKAAGPGDRSGSAGITTGPEVSWLTDVLGLKGASFATTNSPPGWAEAGRSSPCSVGAGPNFDGAGLRSEVSVVCRAGEDPASVVSVGSLVSSTGFGSAAVSFSAACSTISADFTCASVPAAQGLVSGLVAAIALGVNDRGTNAARLGGRVLLGSAADSTLDPPVNGGAACVEF